MRTVVTALFVLPLACPSSLAVSPSHLPTVNVCACMHLCAHVLVERVSDQVDVRLVCAPAFVCARAHVRLHVTVHVPLPLPLPVPVPLRVSVFKCACVGPARATLRTPPTSPNPKMPTQADRDAAEALTLIHLTLGVEVP